MTGRRMSIAVLFAAAVVGSGVARVQAVNVLVTGSVDISTLVTVDDTVLVWTGDHTVTVDATTTKTLAGVNAGGFTAVIDFTGNDRKVIMGNSTGNVVFQDGGGEISVIGAGAGAQTAGFLVPANTTGEIVEIQATIDDADNANHWIIGDNTLLFNDSSAQVGTVTIGGGVAKLDVDQNGLIKTVTPTGDFTVDLASNQTLTITSALSVGANTLTLLGVGSSSSITATAGVALNSASSVLAVSGSATLDDLNLSASATITLAEGVTLTLTDAVAIGANTLTVTGTTGSIAETITATGGLTLGDAASQLKINGDSANPLVISKVDITGADLITGKIDVDQNTRITALTISQNATLDVASGKTLSGAAALTAVKTLTLSGTGAVDDLLILTAAGTVKFTGQGTINTLTNSATGATVDVDESATITNFAVNQDLTLDVATGKELTTTATVAATKVLTSIGAGTVSTVTLNGTAAELNMTTAAGIISTLNVDSNGGILDVDNSCTVTQCNMASGAGDLTVENAAMTITSTGGFAVGNNKLTISGANGTISQVILGGQGAELDVDASSTITALTVSDDATVDTTVAATLTTTATVSAGQVLTKTGLGAISTVKLNGAGAGLKITSTGTVTTVQVTANGGVIDIDETCTVSTISMSAGAGDLTLDVANGKIRTGSTDVNDNRLTLAAGGSPGTITMDTDGGVLDVNASSSPSAIDVTGDVTIDVASSKTLTCTVDIGSKTLTLSGPGTMSRIEADSATINNSGTTITDLRLTPGSNGTLTYNGTGTSTIGSLANSNLLTGGEFNKIGTGTLTISNGMDVLFGKAVGVKMDIDGGHLIVGAPGSHDNITFDDDADEITVSSGATLTAYGSFTVSSAGSNVNLDAQPGSVVNLSSNGGAETLSAAADNDFKMLGTVNINGDNGDYTLEGAFLFQFGDVNINTTGSLINRTPSSTILFVPGSVVDLNGAATLTIDGQATDTRITLGTTDGTGSFTIDRGISQNMTTKNVALSSATYTSADGGAAIDELNLVGADNLGANSNWFTPAQVDNENENDNDNQNENDNSSDQTEDNVNGDGDSSGEPATVTESGTVAGDGTANVTAISEQSNAAGEVGVHNASGGSVIVTVADGNLQDDFDGIPYRAALPVTVRVEENLSGDYVAVVQLCYTSDLLDEAGLTEQELTLYVYREPGGPWELAGIEGQYQGDSTPTETVGDYGYESLTQCVWVVRDSLSDFAAGVGPTEQQQDDGGTDGDDDTVVEPTPRPRLCGIFGMIYLCLTLTGLGGLKYRVRRDRRAA